MRGLDGVVKARSLCFRCKYKCIEFLSSLSLFLQSDNKLEYLVEQAGDMSVDLAGVNENVRVVSKDVSRLREDVTDMRVDIQKVLDNQVVLVALFKEGVADICDRLDALKFQMAQGFESVISTIEDAGAVRVAREFKTKLRLLTLAHDPLVADIINTAENTLQDISEFAKEDADKAIARAEELYAWAETFLPDISQATLNKRAKLELMPYVVAMAYSVRVKLDAQLKSSLLPEAKRKAYLQRACSIVDEFVRVLQSTLVAVTADTSLLEIALDYYQPLAIYATLVASLRGSTRMMLQPEDAPPKEVVFWDDGLSDIR